MTYTNRFCRGKDKPGYCSTFNLFIINTEAHLPVIHQLLKCVKIQVEERGIYMLLLKVLAMILLILKAALFTSHIFLDNENHLFSFLYF